LLPNHQIYGELKKPTRDLKDSLLPRIQTAKAPQVYHSADCKRRRIKNVKNLAAISPLVQHDETSDGHRSASPSSVLKAGSNHLSQDQWREPLKALTQAFGSVVQPPLYRRPMPRPSELGDWNLSTEKGAGGSAYILDTDHLSRQQREDFRGALRDKFKEVTGDVRLGGQEFCPSTSRNWWSMGEDKVLIPGALVEELNARKMHVPLGDIVAHYTDLARERGTIMETLKDRLNETGGVPLWNARYDTGAAPSLYMFLPNNKDGNAKPAHVFEDEEKRLRSAIDTDLAAPPYDLRFSAHGNAYTGKYALLNITAKSDEALCAAVDHLTGSLAPALRDCMTSLMMKAAPETVVGLVTQHVMKGQKSGSVEGKSWKEQQNAHPSMPLIRAVAESARKTKAHTVRAFLDEATLPSRQRELILESIPALKSAPSIVPREASKPPVPRV
jgi:hypothetical protein